MTSGQDALREAMRHEQARIYSQLCPENCSHLSHGKVAEVSDEPVTVRVHDITAARRRRTA